MQVKQKIISPILDVNRIINLSKYLSNGINDKLVIAELLIAAHYLQLVDIEGYGFMGWFRWKEEAKDLIVEGEIPLHLMDSKGPLIQIVSLYAPNHAGRGIRWLSRMYGVKVIFGYLNDRWRELICHG